MKWLQRNWGARSVDGPPKTTNPPEVAASEGPKSLSGGDRLGDKDTTKRREDYARERYALHGSIRRHLIGAAAKSHPGHHPGNVYRTAACTWVAIDGVTMVRPADRETYHYKGLATCGSVWVCPLCAAKIQERRRQEVLQAVVIKEQQGLGAVMLSLTFPHNSTQALALLLDLQQQALKSLRESRGYKSLMKQIGSSGRIRALEVTHGANGWHPHTHELLFVKPGTSSERLEDRLAELWLGACRRVGLFDPKKTREADFLRYSVDVQEADDAVGEYLAKIDQAAKWNVSHELTKSSSKQGRRSGQHPFRLAMERSTSALFLEYVDAMKGARQLVWSRGLKSEVGIDDKTDQELAQEETSRAIDSIDISRPAWRVVLGNDARWEMTEAARKGGASEVAALLRLLGYQENKGNEKASGGHGVQGDEGRRDPVHARRARAQPDPLRLRVEGLAHGRPRSGEPGRRPHLCQPAALDPAPRRHPPLAVQASPGIGS